MLYALMPYTRSNSEELQAQERQESEHKPTFVGARGLSKDNGNQRTE